MRGAPNKFLVGPNKGALCFFVKLNKHVVNLHDCYFKFSRKKETTQLVWQFKDFLYCLNNNCE